MAGRTAVRPYTPLPQGGRGAGGEGKSAVGRTAVRPYIPLPQAGEGGNLWQGAPPCAPTPLSHAVGEGLGVRANKRVLPAYRTQAMYPCQGGSRGERLFALACFMEGVETGWEQQGAPLSTTCALSGV